MSQDENGREAAPLGHEMTETVVLTEEQRTAQKSRNRAIALALVAFVLLVFVVSFFRFQQAFETRQAAAQDRAEAAQEAEPAEPVEPE